MKKIVKKVQEFPHTTLAVVGILGTAALVQTIRLQVSQLTTYQITRAAEDLGLDKTLLEQIEKHGPYYAGK